MSDVFNLAVTEQYLDAIQAPEAWKHKFDELTILFNPEWKNVAVNVSGGADSACLTSILATIIKENNYNCKIHVISHVRVWHTRPWGALISLEVYNKLKEMWGDIIGERLVNFIPTQLEEAVSGPDLIDGRSGDRIIVGAFNQYASYTYNFDAVFNGTTLNPQEMETDVRPHDRNYLPDFTKETFKPFEHELGKTLHPFRFVEKDFIIGTYLRHGWDNLLKTTRSCEGDVNVDPEMFVDYTKYKHGVTELPECGRCFWCKEREWATRIAKEKLKL